MTDEAEPCVHVHIVTSGTTRNPLGSHASPNTLVDDDKGAHMINIVWNGEKFNPKDLGEEDPRLKHLEAYIREHALEGTWKLSVVTPLWDAIWERNAEGDWLCTEAGMGYA